MNLFRSKQKLSAFFVLGFTATFSCLLGGCQETGQPTQGNSISRALSNDEKNYARVLKPREFSFPADYGPHESYKTEWWYFTGNLKDKTGRKFGYELTFFRIALDPGKAAGDSRWRSNQLYMAHFALTDIGKIQFRSFERFSREALGLAGAQPDRFHVWLHDWSATMINGTDFPIRLHAAIDNIVLDLELTSVKPIVLQGRNGLSQKSAEPGQASYYYSLTRLVTNGSLRIDRQLHQLQGTSWMDREWSTSALSKDQAGWDWFALQLDDGRELMYYRFRRKDGAVDPFSGGRLVNQDGTTATLSPSAVSITEKEFWQSPRSKARYPSKWLMIVPEYGLELEIKPLMKDQELDLSVKYWEGAIQVQGKHKGQSITGVGYVELTGYTQTSILANLD